jgi:diguanylate cyclase (GGDEF)-like protein/PAS domain S-box-containing protein
MSVREYLRRFFRPPTASYEATRLLAEGLAAIVVLSEEGRVTFVNPAARAITGYREEELLGRPLWELVHPEHRESVERSKGFRPEGSAPSRHEVKLVNKAGRDVWVELTFSSVRLEGQRVGIMTALDVTSRRLAEGAMRESERRFRDLLESVQLISVTLDVDGLITFANPYLLELAGVEEEDVIGRNWFDLFVPEDERESARTRFLERVKTGVISPHEETALLTRLGERRQVSWNNTIIRDYRGRVVGAASIGADATERRRAEERLLHDAFHDPLTGLPNRVLLMDRVATALARSRRGDYLCALLLLDLDRFKLVNETLGHRLGDQFLVEIGRLLSGIVRPGDTVARLGGDEFVLMLDDIRSPGDAEEIARNVAAALDRPVTIGGSRVAASASIGITFGSAGYREPEEMLRDADAAMYQAKAAGRAQHRIFDASMHNRAMGLLKLENSLRRAVDKGEFVMHYQPIVNLDGRDVAGFEALARWDHPQRGLLSPTEWIHLAEEAGLIYRVGRWALTEACSRLRSWEELAPPGFSVSVNISSRQFSQPDLVEDIASVLRETGAAPGRLKLEITESVLMEDAETAVSMLTELRGLGVRVCIDDFGSGYSSLGYLLRFPADTLKIDRSFVSEMGRSDRGMKIIATIVSLGRSLGLEVVAEGVEDETQRSQLMSLGCLLGQGFLFAKPLDEASAGLLLSDARAARSPSPGVGGP